MVRQFSNSPKKFLKKKLTQISTDQFFMLLQISHVKKVVLTI